MQYFTPKQYLPRGNINYRNFEVIRGITSIIYEVRFSCNNCGEK